MIPKVDIISGFLGAGKTTFIKKLLSEAYVDEKIVIIENEFGKVNIDGAVLKDSGYEVKEITSGCICCSLSGDFVPSVLEVIEEHHPDRIIIEPTGVARLTDIVNSLKQKKILDLLELDHVITILDVKRFNFNILCSKDFLDNQIRATESIIFSKVSGTTPAAIADVTDYIKGITENKIIVNLDWEQTSAKEILAVIDNKSKIAPQKTEGSKKLMRGKMQYKSAEKQFETCELDTNRCFSFEFLRNICSELGNVVKYGIILRGKGIVKVEGGEGVQFDYVPGEITFKSGVMQKQEKICIIGIYLNKYHIKQLFETE